MCVVYGNDMESGETTLIIAPPADVRAMLLRSALLSCSTPLGYECGLVFEDFNDVKEEDLVEAYIMVEVPR